MLKLEESKYIEKVIKKAIKKINQTFSKNKYYLGRFIIRDCFHQILFTPPNFRKIVYCFECIDKGTCKHKFFQIEISEFDTNISVQYFTEILSKKLEEFSATFLILLEEKHNKRKIKDFRKVKIDD